MRSLRVLRISVVALMAIAALVTSGLQGSSQAEPEELPPFIVTVSFPDDAVAFVDLLPDGTTRVTKVRVPGGPIGVAVHPNRHFTYVPRWTAKALTVLDNARRVGIWAGTFGGNLYAVAFRPPDGDVAYITDAERKRIIALDTRDPANPQLLTYIALPGARAPRNLAFTRDGQWAIVSDSESSRVQVIDAQQHQRVGVIDTGGRCAVGVRVSNLGRWLYVADRCLSTVYAIEIESIASGAPEITPIPLSAGTGAWYIAFSPDDRFAYVSQTEPRQDVSSGEIAVIDTREKRQIGTVVMGGFPAGLLITVMRPDQIEQGNWQTQLFVFTPQSSIQRVALDFITGEATEILPPISIGLLKELIGMFVQDGKVIEINTGSDPDRVEIDSINGWIWVNDPGRQNPPIEFDPKKDTVKVNTNGGVDHVIIEGSQGGNYEVDTGDGNDTIEIKDTGGPRESSKYIVKGGKGDDTIYVADGSGNDEYNIDGEEGDDTITVVDSNDRSDDQYVIDGGEGLDTLYKSDAPEDNDRWKETDIGLHGDRK